jgi:O-antigen ligase
VAISELSSTGIQRASTSSVKPPSFIGQNFWNLRLLAVCLLAIAVSLPIALVSLSKLIVFVAGLVALFAPFSSPKARQHSINTWTYKVTVVIVLLLFLSLTWIRQDFSIATTALVKHTKILEIILIGVLIRTPREAMIGIMALLAGQAWALSSSLFMAADLALPWISRPAGLSTIEIRNVPYADSYLDQSMMFATTSGIAWHLRHRFGRFETALKLLALGLLLNVFFLLPGRSGYVMGLATLVIGATLATPPKFRAMTLLISPIILATVLAVSSERIYERGALLWSEFTSESDRNDLSKSTSFRLAAWRASVVAIGERPIIGFGVGGWKDAIDQQAQDSVHKRPQTLQGNNPHQQILLWGVELGLFGIILTCAFFIAVFLDAKKFPPDVKWATWSVGLSLLLASLFNSPLYDDLLGDYFCVALGLILIYGRLCAAEQQVTDKVPA